MLKVGDTCGAKLPFFERICSKKWQLCAAGIFVDAIASDWS
jgi:hypothetical protein